ncbi:Leo1-like protein-domain-containing protein [Hypoxylon sp. NC1633]|nr:Leo1-like protein-domain-containing protein [Hypoxylon sp. NC1633]
MSDSEGGDDLFGDESDQIGDAVSDQDHGSELNDDQESDNDRDHDHHHERDGANDDAEDQEVKMKRIMAVTVHRHKVPKASNGFLQTLKVPAFLKLQADEYKPDTFEATDWDIKNVRSDKHKNVIRYQRDAETGELKSNTVVYRWSDGSLTMAVGNDHYEIQKKSMAPSANKPYYEEREDAHYYVAAAHFTSELFVTVGHVSEQYSVSLPSNLKDEAIIKFNKAMEAAARSRRSGADMIITATKDPELQKREAEAAEKERMKAQRKRDSAAARLDGRVAGTYRSGGLSIGDLEERRRAGGPRKRGAGGGSKGKRRRPEYDSDDDFAAGSGRQNEYDREDDFIAPSDDDEEGVSEGEEDDEEEDILEDEEEEEAPRKKRQKTAEVEEDADADADADLDDVDVPAQVAESSHRRRRHIIDEDEDEE